ncbi:unnamed protein product [Closterium sp. NIES-64]|nr:unnamed protein product [Closterium sp. NIES-64]
MDFEHRGSGRPLVVTLKLRSPLNSPFPTHLRIPSHEKGGLEGDEEEEARRGGLEGNVEEEARRGGLEGNEEEEARRGGLEGNEEEEARRGGLEGNEEEEARMGGVKVEDSAGVQYSAFTLLYSWVADHPESSKITCPSSPSALHRCPSITHLRAPSFRVSVFDVCFLTPPPASRFSVPGLHSPS